MADHHERSHTLILTDLPRADQGAVDRAQAEGYHTFSCI
ncbi:protein of unknown function [Candidatus Bipolaricaulis anaerobius]|uniref:Uncharacterized protein n=1 Tax=Candidatus Bipolaricaulis anaerobius TaxID=2026885 RepID=A0A2X3L1D3_9BACT|nr:protein of unknown function [Candidatus Bipolaricaulis anaerobius]